MNSESDYDAKRDERAMARSAARAPASAGPPPSITGPVNSIRVLRHGIDSLYVSYKGKLDDNAAIDLQQAKELAQSSTDEVLARAHIEINDHTFTVLPRGRGRFAYVVEDNWFSIQLSNAASLPMAHVQILSEYLTAVGPEEALRTLNKIVFEFGECGEPSISRIDLFADFVGDHDLPMQPGFVWGYQDAVMSGGSNSPRRTANEYASLLGLATRSKRRNTSTG